MEISSPPYPKNNASPAVLYRELCELYVWTANHREWANTEALRLNAPDDPFIPELGPIPSNKSTERFLNLAVPDMFMSWQMLRKIRERYDDIVRNYESERDWESDASVFHRISVVKMAAVLLSLAFLDYERREAKGHEYMKKIHRDFLRNLKKVFKQIDNFSGEEHDSEAFDADFNFDDLFNDDNDKAED